MTAQADGPPEVWRDAVGAFRSLARAFENPWPALSRSVVRAESFFGLSVELPMVNVSIFGGLERAASPLEGAIARSPADGARRLQTALITQGRRASRSRLPHQGSGNPTERAGAMPVPVFSLRRGSGGSAGAKRPEASRRPGPGSLSASSVPPAEERARPPRERPGAGLEGAGEIDAVAPYVSHLDDLADRLLTRSPGRKQARQAVAPEGIAARRPGPAAVPLGLPHRERVLERSADQVPERPSALPRSPIREYEAAPGRISPGGRGEQFMPIPGAAAAHGDADAHIREGMALVDNLADRLLSTPGMPSPTALVPRTTAHLPRGPGPAREVSPDGVEAEGGEEGGPDALPRAHRELRDVEGRTHERAGGRPSPAVNGPETAVYRAPDADVIVSLVTDALLEQARRNGVDLS